MEEARRHAQVWWWKPDDVGLHDGPRRGLCVPHRGWTGRRALHHILNDEFLATLRDYGLEKSKAISFSTTTTPSTPPASPVNGSKATRSGC
jgi:hypothetical protein